MFGAIVENALNKVISALIAVVICLASNYAYSHASAENSDSYGKVLEIYPWTPTSPIKILPFTSPIPTNQGIALSISACKDQFQSASFIIRAKKALSGVTIRTFDFTSATRGSIPRSSIDTRLVKCWYQAGDKSIANENKRVLVPELLLRDDELVKVDYVNKTNYLRITQSGKERYIDISSPPAKFPENTVVMDSDELKPFDMEINSNKQIWLTVHVPKQTMAGEFHGKIEIGANGHPVAFLDVQMTVLPFTLEEPVLEYSLYYRGTIVDKPVTTIDSENKTAKQYKTEMKDMKDHGIRYPTMYQGLNYSLLKQELAIRKEAGLPMDRLYVLGTGTGNAADLTALNELTKAIQAWKSITEQYGVRDLYFYGKDEGKDDVLMSQRPAWETVHNAGGKVFVACYKNAVNVVGDLLDIAVLSSYFKPEEVERWHAMGKRVLIYGNPQVGIEDPSIYRHNYGIALRLAGYDGEMNYAYQHSFGHIWNDFDDAQYRDHVFAYPTSNGVVDTVQWEGFREAVNDVRYLSTLLILDNEPEGKKLTWIKELMNGGHNPDEIRGLIAERIVKITDAMSTHSKK